MFNMVAEIWGKKKVPIVAVVGVLMIMTALHEWADMHYMPVEIANASDTQLEKKIDANTTLIVDFIEGYELNENRKAIELIKDQQFDLKQFEASNGPSSMIDERRDELSRKLDILYEERECLRTSEQNHCA